MASIIILLFFLANDNVVSLTNNGKLLTVPIELSEIGVEIMSGQTIFINLRNVNLKIIWKSNVSFVFEYMFTAYDL